MSGEVQATVREVNGQLVLDDPAAEAVIRVVEAHNRGIALGNCRATLDADRVRLSHFVRRIAERGDDPNEVCVVCIRVDDPHGRPLADALMPGYDWQSIRDKGETPYARGLAMRGGIGDALAIFERAAAERLADIKGVAIVVIDCGVADVYRASEVGG